MPVQTLTLSLRVQSSMVWFLGALMFLYQKGPRHVVALSAGVGVACWWCRAAEAAVAGGVHTPWCARSGVRPSVRPPDSRTLPLTSQVRRETRVARGNFHRHQHRSKYKKRTSAGGGLCVPISIPQQNRCMNGDSRSLQRRGFRLLRTAGLQASLRTPPAPAAERLSLSL